MITRLNPEVLRAALRRRGVWMVDVHGTLTQFYHRVCWQRAVNGERR